MKVRKNGEQKNVIINNYMYNEAEIKRLLGLKIICWFDFSNKDNYKQYTYNGISETYRLFVNDLKEIKVIYHKEAGEYTTVGIDEKGTVYYITL